MSYVEGWSRLRSLRNALQSVMIMGMRRLIVGYAFFLPALACVHRSSEPRLGHVQWLTIAVTLVEKENYDVVPADDAERLGCKVSALSPICSVGFPSSEEDSAFRAEVVRLAAHANPHCRSLSSAMRQNLPQVRMYPRALVTDVGPVRYYGVGHSYKADRVWQIRIARRLTDLNVRSLDQKARTFRHEAAHTLGASEERLLDWSAEEFADRCS